ncbi:hypothetical protein [Flavobacterium foetidum]|uniref:hypothetical protein n=1 Tax=Flavobacterium foetidum TaxID=2026681 RepID=UPI0010752F17|nr:hypothetical protein [Flavobacterium foetidum]KAF2509092.1 hypothetical protein E0W73_18970 [Flavobacterium foetidum]
MKDKNIPKIVVSENVMKVLDFSDFSNFKKSTETITGKTADLLQITSLIISGSTINSFDFLRHFPSLKKLGFLACKSDYWTDLKGNENITSLRLHNLKQDKKYLQSIDFIRTFSNVEYLYLNLLGIDNFSELQSLKHLHTIFAVCRNENDIRKQFDFSALEFLPCLKVFDTWMAVDKHRILAENLIPLLKNTSLSSLTVTQMFPVEDKKLQKLIGKQKPSLLQTTLSNDELGDINRQNIAW